MAYSKLTHILLLNLIIIPVYGLFAWYLIAVIGEFQKTVSRILILYLSFCTVSLEIIVISLIYKDPGKFEKNINDLDENSKQAAIDGTFEIIGEVVITS